MLLDLYILTVVLFLMGVSGIYGKLILILGSRKNRNQPLCTFFIGAIIFTIAFFVAALFFLTIPTIAFKDGCT
jgi:hypothetical protein